MPLVKLNEDSTRFVLLGGDPRGNDVVHATIKRWPGWRRMGAKTATASVYSGPLTAISALCLRKTALELRYANGAESVVDELVEAHSHAQAALSINQAMLPGIPPTPTSRKPLPHQWSAITAMGHLKGCVILGDDMGLGKTATALWVAYFADASRILIVCPSSVKWNWWREINATLGEHAWWTTVIDGSRTKRADAFSLLAYNVKRRAELATMSSVEAAGMAVIINYDLLRHLPDDQLGFLSDFVKGHTLICDESHYLRKKSSARTKIVTSMFTHAKQRMLLSGTPIMNTAEDLFSQIEIVQPGTFNSYHAFCNRYLHQAPLPVGKTKKRVILRTVGAKNTEELGRIVSTIKIARLKDEVLSLPEKTLTQVDLELDDDSRKLYAAMRDFAILKLSELGSGESIFNPQAKSGLIAAMRCEQLCQGFVGGVPEVVLEKVSKTIINRALKIKGRPTELVFPDSVKMAWIKEQIDALLLTEKSVVVFCRFNAPLQWLAQFYESSVPCGVLHGDLNAETKDSLIEKTQSGEVKLLLCQVTIAQGFTITKVNDILFLGRDWLPAINAQAIDRCHRIGQKGTVNVQIPIVLKTIEERIDKALQVKHKDAQSALGMTTVAELKEML